MSPIVVRRSVDSGRFGLFGAVGERHRSDAFAVRSQEGADATLRLYLRGGVFDVARLQLRRGTPDQPAEPVAELVVRLPCGVPAVSPCERRAQRQLVLPQGTYFLELSGSAPFGYAVGEVEARELGRIVPPVTEWPVVGDALRALEQFVRSPLFVPGAIALVGLYIYSRAPAERRERLAEGAAAAGRAAVRAGRTLVG